jgi:PPE-repeat protein
MRKSEHLLKKIKKVTRRGSLLFLTGICGVIIVLLTYGVVSAYNYQPPTRKITKTIVTTPIATVTVQQTIPPQIPQITPTPRPRSTPTPQPPTVAPTAQATAVTVLAQPARTIIPATATPVPSTGAATTRCLVTLQGNVYDVTSLMTTHSGGNIFICSSDQTQLYLTTHGISLSRMTPYLVSGSTTQIVSEPTLTPTPSPGEPAPSGPIPLSNFNFGDDGS